MPVESKHESVICCEPQWRTVRDVLAGPAAIKSEERRKVYLPRLPGHRIVTIPGVGIIDEYLLYLDRAVILSGFAERVLGGLAGMAMRKPPTAEVPAAMEADLENLTLDGTTLAGFAKDVLVEDLSTSWGGVMVDWSERWERPYQRLYCAESVFDWRIGYLGGQPIPTQVRLLEPVSTPDPEDEWREKAEKQIRVLQLVPDAEMTAASPDEYPFGRLVHRLFRLIKDKSGKESWTEIVGTVETSPGQVVTYPFTPVRRERPLGFIPFQPFNALNALWQCGRPALLNLINMILACYKNSADYENSIHCAGVPTLSVWGIKRPQAGSPQSMGQIEIGPGRLISGEDPAGHAEYVQTEGKGAAELKEAIADKKAEMATMAARLLLSRDRRVAETAEAQEIGFSADDASLTTVADAVEQALTNSCAWHAWWGGSYATVDEAAEDVSIKLNREFLKQTIGADELNRLGLEVEAGRLPLQDYFIAGQRGGQIRPDLSFEDYRKELAKRQAEMSSMNGDGFGAEIQDTMMAMKKAKQSGDPAMMKAALAQLDSMMSDG